MTKCIRCDYCGNDINNYNCIASEDVKEYIKKEKIDNLICNGEIITHYEKDDICKDCALRIKKQLIRFLYKKYCSEKKVATSFNFTGILLHEEYPHTDDITIEGDNGEGLQSYYLDDIDPEYYGNIVEVNVKILDEKY